MSRLLTRGNPKVRKGEAAGFVTFILHLAPAKLSGYQTCPMATEGCRAACLNTAGRGGIGLTTHGTNAIQEARIRKTRRFFEDREGFMADLVREIHNGVQWARRKGLTAVFRLNGTSDIRWETVPCTYSDERYSNVMEAFPGVQFYDYTKLPNRRDLPTNYRLTFSLAESNAVQALQAAQNGMNVAVVFRKELPDFFTLGPLSLPVINGDETDLRFLDPRGVVVGLKAKGRARKDTSGFVHDEPLASLVHGRAA